MGVKFINLEEIKRILKCKIDAISDSEQMQMYYESTSLEQVLPMDVIQHITIFNESRETNVISKSFNKCTQQNEQNRIKARENAIRSLIGTTEESQTWILHPTRKELTAQEKGQNYKG